MIMMIDASDKRPVDKRRMATNSEEMEFLVCLGRPCNRLLIFGSGEDGESRMDAGRIGGSNAPPSSAGHL